jgi:hypothetical protein
VNQQVAPFDVCDAHLARENACSKYAELPTPGVSTMKVGSEALVGASARSVARSFWPYCACG